MKTSIRTIILASAAIFAAISCQKETSGFDAQDRTKTGETIQLSINACFGDLVSAEGTKATAEPVIRLTWATGDKVDAYCGNTKLNTQPIDVAPSENKMFAKLTGTISTTGLISGTSVITFVYSNGCTATGLEFDFSSQTAVIPFVAYGTLVYDGTAITDKIVEFKFATSVMKIAATNLGGGTISNATISGINTKVTLTPNATSGTCGIAGSEKANITTSGIAASSDGTRAIITIGLVPDNTSSYRMLAVSQTGYTNKGVITSNEIKSNTSYTTPASLFPCGTLGTGATAHDYVLIAGTKWATQNLAVSASGGNPWLSVKVPGTTTPVQIGDYFQWGAHSGTDYTSEVNNDKGLLIYKSFTNNGSSGSFTEWKQNSSSVNYQFATTSISPYYSGSAYTDYTTAKSGTLAPSDDVASILWGGTWRMPTSAEFKALKDATYWAWDGTDKGYYVYAPQEGDAGKKNDEKVDGHTYDESGALLFFPAAGYGYGTDLYTAGDEGRYWSSSLDSDGTGGAYYLYFYSVDVNPQSNFYRCLGFPVRPVSD